MNDLIEAAKKISAGALSLLLLSPVAAHAAGGRSAPTPKASPAARLVPAPALPRAAITLTGTSASPAAFRLPEAVTKAMAASASAPEAARLAADPAAAAEDQPLAKPLAPREAVAKALAEAPQDLARASGEDAAGSGRRLEQAMTGERVREGADAVSAEASADASLAQASAWGKGVVDRMLGEFGKAIIGQKKAVQSTLIALITARSVDLVALPGTGKTEMAKVLAKITGMDYKRVQFTADLMPADITGGYVRKFNTETKEEEWVYEQGPVFTQIFHADELNRAQPKTQGALLEAMQEKAVSAGGVTRELDSNFFLIATRNPIEQDGTYPLPEAQLDRFIGSEVIDEGDEQETLDIVKLNATRGARPQVGQVTNAEEIEGLRSLAEALPMDERVRLYAVRVARATVDDAALARRVRPVVSPRRAAISLEIAARALAVMKGQPYVSVQEVYEVAHMVLRHRISMNDSEDNKEAFIWEILNTVETPAVGGEIRLARSAAGRRPSMRPAPAAPRAAIAPAKKPWWKFW